MADVFQIFDADTTLDLRNPAGNYHVLWGRWSPAVSRPREGFVGGQSNFVEVVESLELNITGSDVDTVLDAKAALVEIIDQAQRWIDGDGVNVVAVAYQPSDSTLTDPLKAVIVGYPAGQQPIVGFDGEFDALADGRSLMPVTLRFVREGLWLAVKEEPAASAKSDNPLVRSVSFSDFHALPSPIDIAITGFNDQTHQVVNEGFILATNDTGHLVLESTSGMGNAPDGWASASDTTNKATNGTVLRYTAAATAETSSEFLDLSSTAFDVGEPRVAIFASVRVNTSGRTFKLRANGYNFGILVGTPDKVLPYADYSQPKWVFLGFVSIREGVREINFSASVDSVSGSPTMDIDAVAVLAVDSNAYILSHEQSVALVSPYIGTSNTDVDLIVEARSLSERTPFVGVRELTDLKEVAVGYRGDPAIYMNGSAVVTLWLSTHNQYWRDVDQSTFAITTIGMKAARRKGYLSPR